MYDNKLLSAVYTRVDFLKLTDPAKLEEISLKLAPVMDRFEDRPQESYLLTQIYNYVDRALNPQAPTTSNWKYSQGLIEALWEMFE